MEVLRAMEARREGDLVFPGSRGGRPLSESTLLKVLRRMGYPALTPHGLCRSTFRTWVSEATSFPRELAEISLAHTQSSLERAYQRGDMFAKRRELMDAWTRFCASNVGGYDISNVVSIKA